MEQREFKLDDGGKHRWVCHTQTHTFPRALSLSLNLIRHQEFMLYVSVRGTDMEQQIDTRVRSSGGVDASGDAQRERSHTFSFHKWRVSSRESSHLPLTETEQPVVTITGATVRGHISPWASAARRLFGVRAHAFGHKPSSPARKLISVTRLLMDHGCCGCSVLLSYQLSGNAHWFVPRAECGSSHFSPLATDAPFCSSLHISCCRAVQRHRPAVPNLGFGGSTKGSQDESVRSQDE